MTQILPLNRWRPLRAILAILLALNVFFLAPESRAQDAATDRAENIVELLQPLLELEGGLQEKLESLRGQEGDVPDQSREKFAGELADVREQISVLVAGVSEQGYQALDQAEFDINREVQNLVEPFVLLLNEATSDARQLERSRRDLDVAKRRVTDAETAVGNIEAALTKVTEAAAAARLQSNLTTWEERLALHQTQVEALQQRVEDLQNSRVNVGRNVNDAFQLFFRDRSISLAMGIGAFFGVMALGRLLMFLGNRLVLRPGREKTFVVRLVSVLFGAVTLALSFAAMLIAFNMRNDWLLLGLGTLLSFAAVWVLLRMLPSLVEQLWVLLNLGAVQEHERVLFNGVPFRVEKLSFYTDLVNPALDGGEFTLPVRELVGMHSRPAAVDEAWFPSEKGDWVRLADDVAGQVVAQTPEMVVVQRLGGAQVTYQTADYLAATPENLSHGYRVEIEFGIAYRHQAEAVTTVIEQMRKGITEHFNPLLQPGELRKVDVEFLRSGASSLDYEVEIDLAGSAASRFEEMERELARCMVILANRHGWEIPFQQVVIHRPV